MVCYVLSWKSKSLCTKNQKWVQQSIHRLCRALPRLLFGFTSCIQWYSDPTDVTLVVPPSEKLLYDEGQDGRRQGESDPQRLQGLAVHAAGGHPPHGAGTCDAVGHLILSWGNLRRDGKDQQGSRCLHFLSTQSSYQAALIRPGVIQSNCKQRLTDSSLKSSCSSGKHGYFKTGYKLMILNGCVSFFQTAATTASNDWHKSHSSLPISLTSSQINVWKWINLQMLFR